MKYKNITNNSIVNLENCEDEEIHIPGLIQPHGFLLSIDSKTNIINVCSKNIENYLPYTYKDFLGKELNSIPITGLNNEYLLFIKSDIASNTLDFLIDENLFSISFHTSFNNVIIEVEPTENQYNKVEKLYSSSKQLLSYIEDTSTLKELCNSVAKAIKNITNYDRVMVYKFDAEYNGEVFAESKEEYLEPFLGLHYPHTDIPKQARELYIKNHLRIIGDINYKPVELYTTTESGVETLDLSLSVLRSVSPIHIQYLQNMGVGATLTVSLMHKGKLWGLIACHHYSPKYLSQEVRNTVKLHGHFITSQIDVRILNEQYETARKATNSVDYLTSKKLDFTRDSILELFKEEEIINLCNSCGVSASVDGKIYTFGKTPTIDEIKMIGAFLFDHSSSLQFVTSSFSKISNSFQSISDVFPGINYTSLGNEKNFIIWYREPSIKEINWAGDPSKSIEKDKNGLSPRKSFEKFTQNVKDNSKIWLDAELLASTNFVNYFQTLIKSIITNEEKEKQKKLSEILRETNEELENINWISTHDLKEPLRKIRMMASTLLRDDTKNSLPNDVLNRIERMQNSAERMQNLITDILKYTKTSSEKSDFELVDLNALLETTKEEIYSTLDDANATITIRKLPKVKGTPFLLKQLFLNTFYNSLKFKSDKRDCKIVVRLAKNGASSLYHVVEIVDNGIGFDNEYSDKIFKIFSRLHGKNTYEGSGIGLALCKKIMVKHNGYIEATGELDKGATIKLFFPKV